MFLGACDVRIPGQRSRPVREAVGRPWFRQTRGMETEGRPR